MDLLVRGKLTPRDLSICFGKIGEFLWSQPNDGLLFAGHLQKQAREFVLHLGREASHTVNRVFQQFGHRRKIGIPSAEGKDFAYPAPPWITPNQPRPLYVS